MKSNTKFYLFNVVITLVVALAVSVGALFAFDVPVVQGVSNFDSLTLSENLIVTGTSTLTGATTQTGALTMAGLLNANGGIAVDTNAFTVADTSGNTAVAGTLGVTGASTLTGALAANGGITVDTSNFTVNGTTGALLTASTLSAGDKATFNGETVFATTHITPTAGQEITVASSAYIVESTAAVSLTLVTTGATAGQIVILYGADANNVTVNDTNLKSSDGNAIVLGQFDILILWFDGTYWVELSKTAAS